MRIAVVTDIHGNWTALEAVLADLRETSPDLILHGGDLLDGGSSPVAVADCVRDLGWLGVLGNGDEMLAQPESLDEFASGSKAPESLWVAVREMAAATRAALGEERIGWLGAMPPLLEQSPVELVHASPECVWRAPGPEASNSELESLYGPVGQPVVVYGHVHRPFVRRLAGSRVVVNAGSVGLPYDGDPRASYVLIDNEEARIRRVEYEVEKEVRALENCGIPHADWVVRMIRTGCPGMP